MSDYAESLDIAQQLIRFDTTNNDPDATVLPYLLSAGTDNKTLGKLGIKGYGFSPVNLPEGFDFPAMFHGIDERVPVASLPFGSAVLRDFVERL